MNLEKISDEELRDCLQKSMTMESIAKKYDVSLRNLYARKAKLIKKGWSPEHDWNKQVPDGYKIKGVSTLYVNGQVRAQWVKSKEDYEKQQELIKEYITALNENLLKIEPKKFLLNCNNNLLACYPLGDPHIGMLAWAEECGDNWDLKIAERVFCAAADYLIKSSPSCSECLLINLGDFFHTDNMQAITSRSGHSLDVDGRYAKMMRVGIKIIRQMIESALEHHEKVRVINVIGNHDDIGAQWLTAALANIYENESRFSIDENASPFHYYRFGKVLIGTHHGHTCKMDRLPLVMATDRNKDWGETEFRYWLTGHIHQDKVLDPGGCKIESFRTLAGKDSFASWGGWRSGQDSKAIIYHKDYGEVYRNTANIAMFL